MGRNDRPAAKPDSFVNYQLWVFCVVTVGLAGWVLLQVHSDSSSIAEHTAKLENLSKSVDRIEKSVERIENNFIQPRK